MFNTTTAVSRTRSQEMARMLPGILNIDKPPGLTSRAVVNRVARRSRRTKVGHAGTLDPLATGVLLVLLGAATRLADYIHRFPKRYEATFLLGFSSDTEDTDGLVQAVEHASRPTGEALEAATARLVGTIAQRPPAFSAIRVAGQRAYDRARKGDLVELAAREVTVHQMAVLQYEYPEVRLSVECSTGTYVRALGRDLAESLGTKAVMSQLVRTAIGPYELSRALPLAALDAPGWEAAILPARSAVGALPTQVLGEAELRDLSQGRRLLLPLAPREELAGLDDRGRLRAILAPCGAGEFRGALQFPAD